MQDPIAALIEAHRRAARCCDDLCMPDLAACHDAIADAHAALAAPTPMEELHVEAQAHEARLSTVAAMLDRVEAGKPKHTKLDGPPVDIATLCRRSRAVSWEWPTACGGVLAWLERDGDGFALMTSLAGPSVFKEAQVAEHFSAADLGYRQG